MGRRHTSLEEDETRPQGHTRAKRRGVLAPSSKKTCTEILQEKNDFLRTKDGGYLDYSPKDILGLTDSQINLLYNEAIQYLAIHELEHALRGFQLLSALCPYDADFWMGCGIVQREFGNNAQALSSFLMAETLDSGRFDVYQEAIHLCLDTDQIELATDILKRCKRNKKLFVVHDKSQNYTHEIELLEEEIKNKAREKIQSKKK